MFEVNGKYANRKGEYTVLMLNPPKMTVRFDDGSETTLNINIQSRIWENILAEREAETASRAKRAQQNKHFIKVISAPDPDDLSFPGWHERVIMVPDADIARQILPGDRIIYYALESRSFIAVATVTGAAFEANPKNYFYTIEDKVGVFFPMDRDADAHRLENGVPAETIELESLPGIHKMKLATETMILISEDDFELLAESLTEVSEEDDEIDEDIDEEEDE